MNELLDSIAREYATLQTGLGGLLLRLQTVNARVREARSEIESIARTVDAVAPTATDDGGEILTLAPIGAPSPSSNGHATAPGSPLGAVLGAEAALPLSEDGEAPRTAQNKPWLPKTWEQVRSLSSDKMAKVLRQLELPIERGKGSFMRNCTAIGVKLGLCVDKASANNGSAHAKPK